MIGAVAQGMSALSSPANLLTVARILASPVLFWLVLSSEDTVGTSWGAFALGWLLGATDFYDGRLARRAGSISRSGAFLDPLADKIVVLGTMICLVVVERYWWVPVAIVAAREWGITLWRTYWARRGLSIPARRSAKYKTLVQGLALAIALFPPFEDATVVVAAALWVAVVLTVVTGLQYLIDGRRALSATGAHA
jgi:CDP-diacylglycerol---glycerol-3-phosphate 3-phosphatidyltransferase